MHGKNTLLGLLIFGLSICVGCGDSDGVALNPVKGKVTREGKPLAKVMVTFMPTAKGQGIASTGLTGAGGEFVLICQTGKAGAVAGKHKVVLTIPESATTSASGGKPDFAKMAQERETRLKAGQSGAPLATDPKDEIFPSEYSSADKSPLTYEVKSGSNDFDIAIP